MPFSSNVLMRVASVYRAGRLGEVLLLVGIGQLHRLALAQVGQGGANGGLALLLGLHIHGGEAGEFQAGVGGTEQMGGSGDINGHAVVYGRWPSDRR